MTALILILLVVPGLVLLIGTVVFLAFYGSDSEKSEDDRK
jgi:flagellar basal body-associated protein FliL